jgi:hypothetical protein
MYYYLILLFLFYPVILPAQAARYDVLIDEIMADPSPVVGLPNAEWIELRNRSAIPVNLQGWRIGDATGQSGPMPDFILNPDSFVVVCAGGSAAALAAFSRTIVVSSFPSLDNESDRLFLKSNTGTTIHAVEYNSSWYGNDLKKEGGWSLEMIDSGNPCSGNINWKASIDPQGGTPGYINTVNGVVNDTGPPRLKNAYTPDSLSIVIEFDKPVDSTGAVSLLNYSIGPAVPVSGVTVIPPLFNQLRLTLGMPLQQDIIYTVTVLTNISCTGQLYTTKEEIKLGRPALPLSHELVINEILFNPSPGNNDYVELYNKSNKLFNAGELFIANRNATGAVSSITRLSNTPFYIFPGNHFVVTEDVNRLGNQYRVAYPALVQIANQLPSFPDDKGSVILLNNQGEIIDEVTYTADWHFKLLNNTEDVSLERIDPAGASQEASNWHSAASTERYGTPTYKNSQYKTPSLTEMIIDIDPPVFSPDNDGFNDIATIRYKMNAPGYIASVTIFDAAGRPVKKLVNNNILGNTGYWHWDGLNDKNQALPVGIYIIFTELFNLEGKRKLIKNVIVLGHKTR